MTRALLRRPRPLSRRARSPARSAFALAATLLLAPAIASAILMLAPALASADGPAPPPAPVKAAFDAFLEGERAFAAGDFRRAAQAFESAYRLAAHPDVLWNAARAWDRAGEAPRAANLYERYLAEAPPGARDRDSAQTALRTLVPRLGRIDVVAPGLADVRVDDQPLAGARLYVTPGAHLVAASSRDRRITRTAEVAAGEAVSVALVDEPRRDEKTPPAPTIIVVPPAPVAAPAPRPWLSTWQRAVAGAGLGVTALSGGFLIASGVDTVKARSAFDRAPTPQALEDGRAKQARTNVLIATTAGLGAATLGATVAFAISGRSPATARAAISIFPSGPSLEIRGRF